MKITKRQLRRIIKEYNDNEGKYSRLEIELFLQDLARSMARDGLSPGAIKMGLQDEFMDNFAGIGISYDDYSRVIDNLSQNPPLHEGVDDLSDWTAGDFAQAIRDYSKELTGRRDTYGSPDILAGMSREELANYYENMGPRQDVEITQDDHLDRQVDIDEYPPLPMHQGMGRRNEVRQRIRKSLKEQLEIVHLSNLHDLDPGRELGHSSNNDSASMARGQLFNIAKNAQSLHDKLNDNDSLPKWVQSKIAVMEDNMDAVFDFLTYQIHKEEH